MINSTEQEEREYLEIMKDNLVLAIKRVDENVRQHSKDLREKKEYIHDHQSGMDEADMVAAEQSINRMAFSGENAVARKRKLLKLMTSPYFARIDFAAKGGSPLPIYIGISTYTGDPNPIYDWRAPVASMFYDFELGPAEYQTPSGKISGTLDVKRQYRIRDGKMEFMIENSLNIQDDVLQKELSKSSDDKMKNIVATIQRDQNAVIRNENAQVMIIQGVAGSGKTSIALHRVAFLLYRFRDTIRSKDVLIISPNKVFADYISSVLPELGEEHIPELGMDELAGDLLGPQVRFQTFFQQVNKLLEKPDADFVERTRFKATVDFLAKLNRYFIHVVNNYFEWKEIRVAGIVIPGPLILEKFKAYHRMPLLSRMPEVINEVVDYARGEAKRRISGHERGKIAEAIPKMFRFNNIFDLYRDFFSWLKQENMLSMSADRPLEYADVFPLIYCKIRLEGIRTYDQVKHLLIDEMQDYTPVHYAVLSRVFQCRKTILGDVSQTVNPYTASSAETIEEVFPHGDIVKLFRSYRSTVEITRFAQHIKGSEGIIAMERHGQEPIIKAFSTRAEEVAEVRKLAEAFKSSSNRSLGIICKTQQQASTLYNEIKQQGIHLLSADSSVFHQGVIVTSAHIAKGLEFDAVVVPFASAHDYHTEVDRGMLYIACTRAMHSLTLLHTGERSTFII